MLPDLLRGSREQPIEPVRIERAAPPPENGGDREAEGDGQGQDRNPGGDDGDYGFGSRPRGDHAERDADTRSGGAGSDRPACSAER